MADAPRTCGHCPRCGGLLLRESYREFSVIEYGVQCSGCAYIRFDSPGDPEVGPSVIHRAKKFQVAGVAG